MKKEPVLPKNESHKVFWLILYDGIFIKDEKKYDLAQSHRLIFAPTMEDAKQVFFESLCKQYEFDKIDYDQLVILEHGTRGNEIYWEDGVVCASIDGREVVRMEKRAMVKSVVETDIENGLEVSKYRIEEAPINQELIKQ